MSTTGRRVMLHLVAVTCSVALGAALVLIATYSNSSPPVYPYPHHSNSGTTGYLVVLGIALVGWGISVFIRCSDHTVRRYLTWMLALMEFWTVAALVRNSVIDSDVAAFAWYLYSLPTTFIPLLGFFCSLHMATYSSHRGVRVLERVLVACGIAICLLTLTNSLHFLAYRFDFSVPDWDERYTYGPIYLVSFVWSTGLYLATFLVVLTRSRRRLRAIIVFVVTVVIIGKLYEVLYAMRVAVAFSSNFSLTYLVFIIAIVESCLDLGLIPSTRWSAELFRRLPLDLKVFRRDGRLFSATDVAGPTSDGMLDYIKKSRAYPGERRVLRISSEPDLVYKLYALRGSRALLTESIESLNAHRRRLERDQRLLRERNATLEHDRQVRGTLHRQAIERELYEDIEASLRSSTEAIRSILSTLPEGGDAEVAEERRHLLHLVKLLVAYCKRKGDLMLYDKGDVDFDRKRIMIVVNEAMVDLRAAGVECAAIVEVEHSMPIPVMNTLYDCLYDFITTTFLHTDPVLLVYITEEDGGHIDLRITMEGEGDGDMADSPVVGELAELLDARSVDYSIEADASSIRLTARLSLREKV